jgi:chemotaxis protein MotB
MGGDGGPRTPIRRHLRGGGHGEAHHGGAWKVAYADFVTAMMAFFMVMWLINQNEDVKRAVGGYFRDPLGTLEVAGADAQQGADGVLDAGAAPMAGQSALLEVPMPRLGDAEGHGDAMRERAARLEKAERELRRELARIEGFPEIAHLVEIVQTEEGLRIELMESEEGAFFALGSPALTPIGRRVLEAVGAGLRPSAGGVVLEGHTDSLAYAGGGYSNWELSTDRANAARRILEAVGLGGDRIEEIRGYAAERPRFPAHPEDPRNRRVSVLLRDPAAPGPPPPS